MNNLKKYTTENLIEYLMQAYLEIANKDIAIDIVNQIQVILHMKVNKKIKKIIIATSYNDLLQQLAYRPQCWLDGYEVEKVKILGGEK